MRDVLIYPPLRTCQVCGDLEVVEKRVFIYSGRRTESSPCPKWLHRAKPIKARMAYDEREKSVRYSTLVNIRSYELNKPYNPGWNAFLNRIDSACLGLYCCGDCIYTSQDRCIQIFGCSPTAFDHETELKEIDGGFPPFMSTWRSQT